MPPNLKKIKRFPPVPQDGRTATMATVAEFTATLCKVD
jgi:hypothetical protein